MGDVKVGCIKGKDIYFLKRCLLGPSPPNGVFGLLGSEMVYLKKDQSVFTHREGPHSTSRLTA